MELREKHHLPQNQGQDMGIEHNALDNRQSDLSTHHLLPSAQQHCKRSGNSGWNCQGLASPGNIYCHKHRLEHDMYNERKRNARQKKESPFLMDPVLPSGQRQCRRTGRGWRCSHLAPPTKIYCQKHELEHNTHSEKKKKKRKRKDRDVIGCDEMKSSSGDCSTVSKRTREKEEGRSMKDVRLESPKRDSGKNVASEDSLFLVNEGVVDKHADKNMSIAQTDSVQLLIPNTEEHQAGFLVHEKFDPFIMEDNDVTTDDQLIPVDPISTRESTVESIEQPQSSSETENSLDFEFLDDEGVLPTLDITCSSAFQQEEAPLLLEHDSYSFMKTSHLWEHIYSMETFKNNPQHPHFRPLENANEEAREGKAMGLMIVFDQLMETTRTAQIDIPETVLISKLDSLTDLEQYGFTVQPLRSRLEKLLKIKNDYILIDESSKTAKEEFINEKRHFDEMKVSIAQLNMELQQLSAKKEIKDMKVLELQRSETEFLEKIQHIRLEFDRVVAVFGNY